MTADQFAKKAAINNPSVGSEFDDLGSVGDGWWEEEGEGEVQREEGKVGRSEGGDVGEGRGFQSMKVMRKYLRGKGKAGESSCTTTSRDNRTNPVSRPEPPSQLETFGTIHDHPFHVR